MDTFVRAHHVPAPVESQLMVLGNYFRVRERYPQVSTLTVELTWALDGYPTVFRVRTFTADDPATFKFPCPFCHDMSIDLAQAVHSLFVRHKASAYATCLCAGSSNHTHCSGTLRYRLRATYR